MLAAGPGLQTEALKRLLGRPAPDRQVPQPHAGPSQQWLRKHWFTGRVRTALRRTFIPRALPPTVGKSLIKKSSTTRLRSHCNAMTRYAMVIPVVTLEADHAARSIQ